jgi:hypothetical protein
VPRTGHAVVRSNNAAVAVVLGVAFSAGAAGLALLAAPSTMTLTRTAANAVTVAVETRLFNRFRIGGFHIDGAQSVEVVHSVVPATGTGPDAPYGVSLYFVTPDGRINKGVRQKLFDGYASEIQSFFSSDRPTVTLSVNDPARRLVRFVVVHLAIVVMSAIGLTALWAGLADLAGRARS